jgi:hypothetical protein
MSKLKNAGAMLITPLLHPDCRVALGCCQLWRCRGYARFDCPIRGAACRGASCTRRALTCGGN